MGRKTIPTKEGYAWCCACKLEKPVGEFSRESRRWNGLRSVCKICVNGYNRSWRDRNPEFNRRVALARYNLTKEDYINMLRAQDSKCAICRKTQNGRQLFVDHNHTTGQVRGLLCSLCNQFLGRIQDNPESLVKYLADVSKNS